MKDETRTASRHMLVVATRAFAGLLSEELSRLLRAYAIEAAHTVVEAEAATRNNNYQWIIVDEKVPSRGDVTDTFVTEADEPEAFAFARRWVEADEHRRAIIITEILFRDRRIRFSRQLFVVERNRAFPCEGIAEMVFAADGGATPITPTVVQVRFFHSMQGSGVAGDPCTIEFDRCCEGPLSYFVERERQRQQWHRDVFGDFSVASAKFHDVSLGEGPSDRLKAVLRAARDLWDALPPNGVVRSLFNLAEKIRDEFVGDSVDFCPFVLHVEAEAEMTALPIDLAIDRQGGTEAVFVRIPVTWRIRAEGFLPKTQSERWNCTDYEQFHAISSCHEECVVEGLKFRRVDGAEVHIRNVLSTLGLSTEQAKHALDCKSLCDVLASGRGNSGCAYIFSHGLVAAGVVVGPIDGTREGSIARAASLAQGLDRHRRRFIYFNCCELGHQLTVEQFRSAYFGGFAHEMLREHVCEEMICNRWSVSAAWAGRLSEEFYRQRPSTAPGRAVALSNARIRIGREIRRVGLDDPSWLAPIHLWAFS